MPSLKNTFGGFPKSIIAKISMAAEYVAALTNKAGTNTGLFGLNIKINMKDQDFREQYHPLQIPAHFDLAAPIEQQILFALAQLGAGSADEVVTKLKEMRGGESDKILIATVHRQLTEWYGQGLVAGVDEAGELRYNLQKITQANQGSVNPALLAPGLD